MKHPWGLSKAAQRMNRIPRLTGNNVLSVGAVDTYQVLAEAGDDTRTPPEVHSMARQMSTT